MRETNFLLVFLDYCLKRRARINNLVTKDNFKLHGNNNYTSLMGTEGDISSFQQYGWYKWCYYRQNKEGFPFNKEVIWIILG